MSIARLPKFAALYGLVLIIAGVSPAAADDKAEIPLQKDICTANHVVDKDKLAAHLVTKHQVSVSALQGLDIQVNGADPHFFRKVLASGILNDPNTCKSCADSDKTSLNTINGVMYGIFIGSQVSLNPSDQVEPTEYFASVNEAHQIRCVIDTAGKPVEAPGSIVVKTPPSTSKIRIRGTASDLFVDRSDKTNFAAASKATLDFASDKIAHKRTYKLVGDIGYDLVNFGTNGQSFELIPYIGANWTISRASKAAGGKRSATETYDFGMLFSAYLIEPDGSVGHLINLRPDYLVDNQDSSKLLTANFQYMPIVNGTLNDFKRLDFLWYKLIVDLRVDNGFYLDRGNGAPALVHKDFVRAGGQFGVAVVTDSSFAVPLSLTSTYTRLYKLSGSHNVGYFANSLTYFLDPNKYFGLTVTYSNGRREDTAKTERQWEAALTAHFSKKCADWRKSRNVFGIRRSHAVARFWLRQNQ